MFFADILECIGELLGSLGGLGGGGDCFDV